MSKDIKPDDIKNTIKELQEIWNCVKIKQKWRYNLILTL